MSLSSNYPTTGPSLLLDFANTEQLDPRITFTRTTTARYYDGKTVAKAEENLVKQSQNFSTASWAAQGSTITSSTAVAPDGTSTATELTDTLVNEAHVLTAASQTIISANQTFTISFFAKNVDINYVGITTFGATNSYVCAEFNLTTGALSRSNAAGAGFSVTSTSITDVGNSWYRCTLTCVIGNTVSANAIQIFLSDGTSAFDNLGRVPYLGTGKKVLVWGAQAEQRSSVTAYTATTTQPITNYIPVLQTAAAGQARFDHNPTTGESLGLLIEEQRANLFTYSDDFANAAWTKGASSITSNTIVAPDGTLTGDKLVEDTTNGGHSVYRTTTLTAASYTFSCYVKAAERTVVVLRVYMDSDYRTVYFNLSTGAVVAGYYSSLSPNIQSVANGWYRCAVTFTAPAFGFSAIISVSNSTSTFSYTGDGYSGIYIWGAQLEAGSFATSYIPTTTASVTRNADAASMTGTNFSSWFNNAEGSLYSEALNKNASSGVYTASINDSSTLNQIITIYQPNSTQTALFSRTSAGVQAQISQTGPTNSYNKFAGCYKIDDFAVSINGSAVSTDTSGVLPTALTTLDIGVGRLGANYYGMSGTIKKLAYYPKRLSNTELQALTTV